MKNQSWLNRHKIIFVFTLCFMLPFAAAKVALAFSLYTPGITAKGEWLQQEVYLSPGEKTRWHLAYVQPGIAQSGMVQPGMSLAGQTTNCDNTCELGIYTLQQLYAGLGKYQDSVDISVVSLAPADRSHDLHWLPVNEEFAGAGLENQLLILNRDGEVLLRYPAAENMQDAADVARDMRSDLIRLLNYDRTEL